MFYFFVEHTCDRAATTSQAEGELVSAGETIAEIETDKATIVSVRVGALFV